MTTFQTLEQLLADTQDVQLSIRRCPRGLIVIMQGQLGIQKFEASGAELDAELGAALMHVVRETRTATLLEQVRVTALPAPTTPKKAGNVPARIQAARAAPPLEARHEAGEDEVHAGFTPPPDAPGNDEHDEHDLI